MADFPVLTLYTDSFMADTDHLTDEEVGAYLRMILVSWRTSSCDIPNDFEWIKRRFSGAKDHPEVYLQLIAEFFTKRGTRLQQKRLMREREWAEKKSSKQSARAKSRWQKENDECRGNAHTHPSGNASPTPTLLESESLTDSESLKGVMESETYSDQLPLTGGGFEQFWNCWTIPGTKRGKGTAKTKYAAVIRRGEISPDRLCASVQAYMAWCLQSELPPSKIKHPATWLNAGAWDDELVADPAPRPKWNGDPRTTDTFEVMREIVTRDEELEHERCFSKVPVRALDCDQPHTGAGCEQGQEPGAVLPEPKTGALDRGRRGQGFRQPFAGPGLLAVVGEGRGTAQPCANRDGTTADRVFAQGDHPPAHGRPGDDDADGPAGAARRLGPVLSRLDRT